MINSRGISPDLISHVLENPTLDDQTPIQGRVNVSDLVAENSSHTHVPDVVVSPQTPHSVSYSSHMPENYRERLLGGAPKYTLAQASKLSGLGEEAIKRSWLLMGFTPIGEKQEEKIFSDGDIRAMQELQQVMDAELLDEPAVASLLSADSHMSDRLLQWHMEVLVEYAQSALQYDAVSARRWALDYFRDHQEFLRGLFTYSWRRQLAGMISHTEAEIAKIQAGANPHGGISQAVGFIDIVSFTSYTEKLNISEFSHFIERFDYVCRAVISSGGGRIVKSMGDAFLFVADDVLTGATIVCEAVDRLSEIPELPAVRASLTWGAVLGRFGDIFGPSVNLASRLVDIASPGTILTTKELTQRLKMVEGKKFHMIDIGSAILQGIGDCQIFELRRKHTEGEK